MIAAEGLEVAKTEIAPVDYSIEVLWISVSGTCRLGCHADDVDLPVLACRTATKNTSYLTRTTSIMH